MIRLLLLLVLWLLGHAVQAQTQPWNASVHYPISIGDSFRSSNQGIIGLEIGRTFAQWGKARIGASLAGSWFATTIINDSDPVQENKYRDAFFSGKFFAEWDLDQAKRLHLQTGLGWGYQTSRFSPAFFDANGRLQGEETSHGPVISLGLGYDLTPNWYVQTQVEGMGLFGKSPTSYVGLLRIGTGFRF
ncbi:hypothetical protein OZ410_03490 [Robiginitalea sp. M366]|uniref:hypothetical protein n=1 Tax=Robiginitalea aestuariiviva TaxID=3036903 RepID=UPI00240D15ED|nr:hypothetical protein [Robiginitalea aestuariiviva]MDG1571363.1 hypothetical protein [Robiginitalea aestuariiviva]